MRVLVAGATGVIGRQLVPLLASVGHEVVGLARTYDGQWSPSGQSGRSGHDAVRFVAADALDRAALERAVRGAAPEAVVNLLTAIPAEPNPKRMTRDYALTNRLRTDGTRNLLDAAAAAGARRIITEGLAYAYAPGDDGPANEDTPLWPDPPAQFGPVLQALRELERQTTDAGGLVLRLGHLYGPGSMYDTDGVFVRQVYAGRLPVVGGGTATFSFIHAQDVASAIVAALDKLDKDVTGVLNVVDDDPTPVREWLPALARLLGAPMPKRVPTALARLAVGGWGVAFMTRLRGADNARARLSLDWRPRYASWRDGFAAELGDHPEAAVR